MNKLILVSLIVIAILNFLYTFGYQGEPMSQIEFLSRTFGSLVLAAFAIILLNKKNWKNIWKNGGSSRTFTLVNGIPSGSSDIGISIRYECRNRSDMNASVRANFNDGKTTTITISPTPDNTVDAILQDCYNYEFIVSD